MNYLFLAIAILAEVSATSLLKLADGFTKPLPSIGVLIGYGISFYCLSLTLRTIPTGIAYAIWSGVGIVLVASVAWIFQGQKLDMPAMSGMGLILAGVVILNTMSHTTAG